MKKLVLFAAAFAAIFVFCGCGNSSKDNSAAEIKECAKNMRRLAKTIDRYIQKHGRIPYSGEKSLKEFMETDITLECPISQQIYKIGTDNDGVFAVECKQHKDKTLRANRNGRVEAIPNDHSLIRGYGYQNRLTYDKKYMIFDEF